MTVGMMGSNLLCQCVDKLLEGCTADSSKQQQLAALDRLPTQFHTELGALLNYPWSVAAGPDAMCALSCLAKLRAAWCTCCLRKALVALAKSQLYCYCSCTCLTSWCSQCMPANSVFDLTIDRIEQHHTIVWRCYLDHAFW